MSTEINLLPKIDRRESNILVLSIMLGTLLTILLVFLLSQYFNAKSELESLTATENQLIATKADSEMTLSNLQGANKDSFVASVEFVESVSYPVTPLIDELESYLVLNSYLTSYSFSESTASISADFETLSEVATYVTNLTESVYFADVKVSNVSKFNLDNSGSEVNEDDDDDDFTVVPRHSVQFELMINDAYLGGGR